MLVAVDLDDQLRAQAAEIGDKTADRNLSAEVRALERKPMANVPPELLLGLGLRSAQRARPRALSLRRSLCLVLSPG
jgi:hypothetical protein